MTLLFTNCLIKVSYEIWNKDIGVQKITLLIVMEKS